MLPTILSDAGRAAFYGSRRLSSSKPNLQLRYSSGSSKKASNNTKVDPPGRGQIIKHDVSMKTTATNSNKTSPFKIFFGASAGIIVICGLDFVAPTEYPFSSNDTREQTYWNKDVRSSDRPQLVPSDTPSQCQVVIVGAGMAGLHTALALSEKHKNKQRKGGNNSTIMILDAGRVGQGASGKSKGLVVPGIQVPEEELADQCGSKEISQKVYGLTYEALRRLKHEIVAKYKIDCDWVDAGLVEASLREEVDGDCEEDDGDEDDACRVLDASEVRRVLGQPPSSTLYKCGEYDPSCSGIDPLALTRGLANVVEGQGVKICEKTKAVKIEKLPAATTDKQSNETYKYVVTTENGAEIQCQHVVLCTGPDLVSKELSKRLENAIIPIFTWMASTAPLGDECPLQRGALEKETGGTVKRKPAPLCGDDYVSLNYWRRTEEDGRLLFGSLANAYPTPQWLAEYRLRRALLEVYPQLPADIPFDHVWGGRLAFSRDAVPLIGRDEGFDDNDTCSDPSKGGVWYATGFGGHGIVPTVMAGSIIADGITGLDDETWRLFHREFPPRYNFWPVSRLGAEAVLTIYNIFDWLHAKGVPVPPLPKPW